MRGRYGPVRPEGETRLRTRDASARPSHASPCLHDMTQTVRQEQALKRIETLTAVIACKSRADLGNAMAGMSQGGFEDFDDEGE